MNVSGRINPINNEVNFGEIVCQLIWENEHRSTTLLAAIPPVGTVLYLEDGNDRLLAFTCVGVSIITPHMSPQQFRDLDMENFPRFSNYVKLNLEPIGEVELDENNVFRVAEPTD